MSRNPLTFRNPAATTVALVAALMLASCNGRTAPAAASKTSTSSPTPGSSETVEQQLADADPFAGVEAPEKRVQVVVPTTLAGQIGLLENPIWQESVQKAHQAEQAFMSAGRMRDAEDEGWRQEAQRGKALMSEALEATWSIEDELSRKPTQARTHEALMRVRIGWNDRLRDVGKLVRG